METQKKTKNKVIIIGDGAVGKTSLIQQFTQETFETAYIKTIGAQFSNYKAEIEGTKAELLFWDIAGQDTFSFLKPSFYSASKAAIIVYSLEENTLGIRSFESIKSWYDDVKQYCGEIPIILFGNKVDLIDESGIDHSRIQRVVKELNLLGYYITSAMTGQGVQNAFHAIIKELLK